VCGFGSLGHPGAGPGATGGGAAEGVGATQRSVAALTLPEASTEGAARTWDAGSSATRLHAHSPIAIPASQRRRTQTSSHVGKEKGTA